MSWMQDTWQQDDSVNFGFPFQTVAGLVPKSNFLESKSIWKLNDSVNFGFPFQTVAGLVPKSNFLESKSIWKLNDSVNFGFPFVVTMEKIPMPEPENKFSLVYKIYYDNELFYRSDFPINDLSMIKGSLSLKVNAAGSLTFSLEPKNKIYESLSRMKKIVKVTKNDRTIWEGRILSDDSDFWQNKEVYCEGILSCLNDTRHPQLLYEDLTLRQYMEALISIHNQKVDESKRFQIGIVTVNNNTVIGTRTTSYESTWELFKGLVDEYGGYLFVRYDGDTRYIDFRKECPRTSSQKIEFGVNLMDFTRSYDMSSLCTVLLPLGKIIASAGNNTIGGTIDSRLADGYYIDPNDHQIYYDSGLAGAYAASNTYFPVQAGKTYYISCRNHDGRVMWSLLDPSRNFHSDYTARSGDGFTDLVEYKLEIPPSDVGGTYWLAIAGFGADIQPRVNESIEADKAFDKYVTVEDAVIDEAGNKYGSLYVSNEEAVTNYGWIEKQLTWNNIDDPNELKRVAEAYLKDGQFDEMTLIVDAVDLQLMGVNTDYIDMLDEVWVVSKPHGLNKTFPVTELTIDLCDPSANKFTLGYKTEQTLSGTVADTNNDIFAKLNAIPSQSATLKSAKDDATMLINNAVSGIFMLEYNKEGINTGFRISNVPDWDADGARGWKFGMGGIGYFGDGFDKPVTLALTGEDGGIVANSITTGQLLSLDIRGGTIGLGHWLMDDGRYIDGALEVKNESGTTFFRVDKNGLFLSSATADNSQVLYIDQGWMHGSGTGYITTDLYFGSQTGVGIHGDVITINTSNLYVSTNAQATDIVKTKTQRSQDGINPGVRIKDLNGRHDFNFVNGMLISYDWDYTDNAYDDIYDIARQAVEDYMRDHGY